MAADSDDDAAADDASAVEAEPVDEADDKASK